MSSSSACFHCSLSFSEDLNPAKRLQRHTSTCHSWLHAFHEADGDALLGVSERADPSGNLACFVPGCSFEEANANVLTSHVSNVHCEGNKLSCRVSSWDHFDDPGLADLKALAVQGPSRSAVASPLRATSPQPSSTSFVPIPLAVRQPRALEGSQHGRSTCSQTQPSTPEPSPPPPAQRRSRTSIDRHKSLPSLTSRAHPYRPSPSSSSHSTSPSLSGRSSPLHVHPTPIHPSPLVNVAFSAPQSPTAAAADDSMDVDEEVQQETEDEFLRRLSLHALPLTWHPAADTSTVPEVLICIACQNALSNKDVPRHVKDHHIQLDKQADARLRALLSARQFAPSTSGTAPPPPRGPPLPHLQVQAGVGCKLCDVCLLTPNSFKSHVTNQHKGEGKAKGLRRDGIHVQTFFRWHPQYFEVRPELAGAAVDGAFALFLDQIAPAIDASTLVSPPVSIKEVPPILQLMQWHEHLADHLKDRRSIEALRSLIQPPRGDKAKTSIVGKKLQDVVRAYMRDIKVKANGARLGARMLLMECPLTTQAGQVFKPLAEDSSLVEYGRMLHEFAHALLSSVPSHPS